MFVKFNFSAIQIKKYYQAAVNDFKIARQSNIPEVIFKFSYDALLKLAIAVCAKNNLRVKARQGHHVELIKKLALILNDSDIKVIGDAMRAKRNLDLYSGGAAITPKEASEYLDWIKDIFESADEYVATNKKLPV